MLNNFEKIRAMMDFSLDGGYYFLDILRRAKDQPEGDGQTSNNIVIKDYYIKSLEHFDRAFPEIKAICGALNARAYIRLNRCIWRLAALETLKIIAECLAQENYSNVKSAFATASGRRCYDPQKKWIIDIDTVEEVDYGLEVINAAMPVGDKVLGEIPTPNGRHIVVKPFDNREWTRLYSHDIHKNNPTVLFAP